MGEHETKYALQPGFWSNILWKIRNLMILGKLRLPTHQISEVPKNSPLTSSEGMWGLFCLWAKRIPIVELSIKLPEKVLGRQSWSLPAVDALGEETAGESFGETMVGQTWEYLDLDLRLPNGNVMCQIHDPGVDFFCCTPWKVRISPN